MSQCNVQMEGYEIKTHPPQLFVKAAAELKSQLPNKPTITLTRAYTHDKTKLFAETRKPTHLYMQTRHHICAGLSSRIVGTRPSNQPIKQTGLHKPNQSTIHRLPYQVALVDDAHQTELFTLRDNTNLPAHDYHLTVYAHSHETTWSALIHVTFL